MSDSQTLSFGLSDAPAHPWAKEGSSTPLKRITEGAGLLSLIPSVDDSVLQMRFTLGIAAAGCLFFSTVTGVFWLGSALLKKRKTRERVWKPSWVIYIIRSNFVLMTGPLFLPTVYTLLSPWSCVSRTSAFWAYSMPCWDPIHSAVTAILTVLMAIFLVFCCVVELLNVTVHSGPLRARVHGRAHCAFLILRTLMASVVVIGESLSTWFIVFCLLCAFGFEATLWISYAPYKELYRNCLGFATSLSGLWAIVAIVVTKFDPDFGAANATYLLLFCLPLVAIGSAVAFWELFVSRGSSSLNIMKSPYKLELHVRAKIFAAQNFVEQGIDEAARANIRATLDDKNDGTAPGKVRLGLSSPMVPTLQLAEHLLAAGMKIFPQSKFLHLIAADFVRTWRVNEHVETSHLEFVKSCDPAMDEAFLANLRSMELEKLALQRDAKHLRIQERVMYEENKAEATNNEMSARGHLSSFWAILSSRNPAISRLIDLSKEIENSVDDTEEAYLAMLDINRRNVGVLRSYAQFVGDVLNDPTLCASILVEADNAEDELSQEHTRKENKFQFMGTVPSLDSASENLAVLSISDKAKNLGHITEANAATLVAFGYSRSDLIGKNVSHLLPEPLASRHDSFIQSYLSSGKARIMGTVRMAFGLHSSGHIFPLLLSVRSLKAGFGGLIQPMNTQHNFILFSSRTGIISAGCKASLSMLGQSAGSLKDGKVHLNKYLHKWKVLAQLCAEMQAAGDDVTAGEGEAGYVAQGMLHGLQAEQLMGGFYTSFKRTSPNYCPSGVDLALMPHIVQARGRNTSTCRVWAKVQSTSMDASIMPGATKSDTLSILVWEPALPASEVRAIVDSSFLATRMPPATTVKFNQQLSIATATMGTHTMNSADSDGDNDSLIGLLDEGPSVALDSKASSVALDSKASAPKSSIVAVSPMKAAVSALRDVQSSENVAFLEPSSSQLQSRLMSDNPAAFDSSMASMKDFGDQSGDEQMQVGGEIPRDDDRASSVGSSDSQAALSSMLRSTVVERNKHPEESVQALQRSLIWVLALTTLFIAASAVMLSVLLANYTGSLGLLHEAANRQVLGKEIMLIVQDQQVLAYQIQLFPLGSVHTLTAVEDFKSGTSSLSTMVDEFESKNRVVFDNLEDPASAFQNSLHVIDPLDMVVEEGGERVEYTRNLNDATFEFMGHVRFVLGLSPAQVFADQEGHIRWLVENAIGNVMPGLNKSTVLYDTTFQSMADEADALQFSLMIASVGLLGIVALAIVIPTTCMAMRARDRIWQLLFNLPARVVTFLQSRASVKLAAMTSDAGIETADAEDAIGFDEDTDDFSSLARIQYRSGRASKQSRKLSNSALEILRTIIVFLFPLLLAAGYYSGTYVWGNAMTTDIAGSAHTLMWSYQRETLSLALLGTVMRTSLSQNSTEAFQEINGALTAANSLVWAHHALRGQ